MSFNIFPELYNHYNLILEYVHHPKKKVGLSKVSSHSQHLAQAMTNHFLPL
jgi:hypothetical protein